MYSSCAVGSLALGDRQHHRAELLGRGVAQHRLEQFVLGGEVVVDQAGAHVELGGDVGDAQVVQPAGECHLAGGGDDLCAPLHCADARVRGPGHRGEA